MNLRGMSFYLLSSVQYGHLSLTIWSQRVTDCCALWSKTDDLEDWGSRSSKVKCKHWFELAAYGFLFAPHTIWVLISGRLAATCHLSFFWMDDLEKGVQGQSRSVVSTDLNSQYMVSYLLPMQYRHLSLTVWSQRVIDCGALRLKTDDLENWGSRSSKVKCKSRIWTRGIRFPSCSPYNTGTYLWPFGRNTPFIVFLSGWPWKMGFKVNQGQM